MSGYEETLEYYKINQGLLSPTVSKRFNTGKPRLSEIWWFEDALVALVEHAIAGREKYEDAVVDGRVVPNWTLGHKPDEEYTDAIARHLVRMVKHGETYDQETGTFHAAAIIWNAAALICNNYKGMAPRTDV